MKIIRSLGVAMALSVLAVVGFSGCAGTRSEQSTGEHIDDAGITHRVKGALGDDTVYKYPDVKVATFKGTVQLSGFVNQRSQKDRAGDLAKKVTGAKDIINNISIKE
jgi:hyperosmotically inducible protein